MWGAFAKDDEHTIAYMLGLDPHEPLSWLNIATNVIYSIFLLMSAMFAAIGIGTYQWVEAEASDIAQYGDIAHIPGLEKVSCGLVSYCIDAAGDVGECTLPWPVYNDDPTSQPSNYWTATAGLIATAVALLGLPWIYSLVSCLGCYTHTRQKRAVHVVNFAAGLMLLSLFVWAAGFHEYAVEECLHDGADSCQLYKTKFPSHILEGGKDNIGCRICRSTMTSFSMADGCHFGWGSFITIAAMIITACAGQCGRAVKPKWDKNQEWWIDYLADWTKLGLRETLAARTSLVDSEQQLKVAVAQHNADLEARAQQQHAKRWCDIFVPSAERRAPRGAHVESQWVAHGEPPRQRTMAEQHLRSAPHPKISSV